MELRLNDESAAEADGEILVFDTGPLTHFARQNWLGILKAVVGNRTALVPDVVLDELQQIAATDGQVAAVLDAEWIERRELRSGGNGRVRKILRSSRER